MPEQKTFEPQILPSRLDVTFFVEAVKILGRQPGGRLLGDQGKLNDLIAALALVEEAWKSMPPAPSGDKMTPCPGGRSQADERREAAVGGEEP